MQADALQPRARTGLRDRLSDGASETAVLLQLARVLKDNPPPVTIWLVFFDGEDYGPGLDRMFIGSRYFAKNQPAGTPRKGVLLDMIGAANVSVPKEQNSAQRASAVLNEVMKIIGMVLSLAPSSC